MSITSAIAQLNPETLGVMIPIGLVVVLPIVAILTNHQRKMAEIIHNSKNAQQNQQMPQLEAKVAQLEAEVRELRGLVQDGIIRADDTAALRSQIDQNS